MTMKAPPDDWRGSDLRSRREVVEYLARHGGQIEDKSGLVVGTMRTELKRGRALAQLLAEMEQDGMIRREVRGRRTFRIELLDDWGLADEAASSTDDVLDVTGPELAPGDLDGVDLTALAETLLAVVVQRMTTPATSPDGLTVRELAARLRSAERMLEQTQAQLRKKSEEATGLKSELDQALHMARMHEHNAEVLRKELQKAETRRRSGGGGAPIAEAIGPEGRAALDQLMRALPETPASRPRRAAK
jgi:hypothetical protein